VLTITSGVLGASAKRLYISRAAFALKCERNVGIYEMNFRGVSRLLESHYE
jgi:hypothetical protein